MQIFLIDSERRIELVAVAEITIDLTLPCELVTSIRGDRGILPTGNESITGTLSLLPFDFQGSIPESESWKELGYKSHLIDSQLENFVELWEKKTEFELELTFEDDILERLVLQKCTISEFNPLILNDKRIEMKIIARGWYAL